MTYEKKFKWTLTGLIVMIVLNAVTLVTFWNTLPKAPVLQDEDNVAQKEFGNHAQANRYFQERLGLTDAQSDSIIALRRKHFGQMRRMREELETVRKNYFDSLIEDTVSEAVQDSMVEEMARKSGAIEQLMSKHMLELNKKLNYQQRQEFAQMMQEMFGGNRNRGRNDRQRNNERSYRHQNN